MTTTQPPAPIDPRRPARLSVADIAAHLPQPATAKWPQGTFDVTMFDRRDGASVLFFAPRGEDHQSPHDRDEFYIVVAGSGVFEVGDESIAYRPGDLLYVPAQMPHRFVAPPDDLALWVVFLPGEARA